METKSIMIVGVGGQGSLLASRLIGNVLLSQGFDVKVSEVHGMSQRGGSVVTYVKYGDRVNSPVIEKGEADIIISFEQLEAARWLSYLKKDGVIIVNTQKILPMPVVMGVAQYPDMLIEKIQNKGVRIISCDALEVAERLGNEKAVNVVLIGLLARNSGLKAELFIDAVKACVPARFIELNLKAFEAGYNIET